VAPGRFITFFYGIIDSETNHLSYCCAGHNPPVLVRSDNSVAHLEAGGLVFGLSGEAKYQSETILLQPGDRVVMFTDGITEAGAPEGEEFGLARLLTIVKETRGGNAHTIQDAVVRAVSDFSNGFFHDDATLLTICAMGRITTN